MSDDCVCEDTAPYCEREHPEKWFCTRKPGHDGDHVACGSSGHEYERWNDE